MRGELSLRSLNRVVRKALGWDVDHQYTLGVRRPWSAARVALVERKAMRLCDVVGPGDALCLSYDYGHGSGWEVDAVVESVEAAEAGASYPGCVAGRGVAPRGPSDRREYYDLLRALEIRGEPGHEQAQQMRQEGIGAEGGQRLDLVSVNAALKRGRYPLLEAGRGGARPGAGVPRA